MIKTLYFSIGSDPSDAANDAILINADTFLGMEPATATTTVMNFAKTTGTADVSQVTLTHAEARGFEVMQHVAAAMASNPRDGFINICSTEESKFTGVATDYITDVAFSL